MSEPTHYKQKQEKTAYDAGLTNEEKRRNKTIFSFPQKISRSEKKRMGSAYRLHRRTCYTKKEPPRRISEVLKVAATYSPTTQCSTIGDAELNDPVRNGKGWDLSAITTLIIGKSLKDGAKLLQFKGVEACKQASLPINRKSQTLRG